MPPSAKFHFFIDDTVIYCRGSTLADALGYSQKAELNELELVQIPLNLYLCFVYI